MHPANPYMHVTVCSLIVHTCTLFSVSPLLTHSMYSRSMLVHNYASATLHAIYFSTGIKASISFIHPIVCHHPITAKLNNNNHATVCKRTPIICVHALNIFNFCTIHKFAL